MDKLIVKIQGGLGNQLFEYAFFKALSMKRKEQCLIDIHEYDTARRGFGLSHFNTSFETSSLDDRERFRTPNLKLRRQLKKILMIPYKLSSTHILDAKFTYDEKFFDVPAPCFFEGFWQSEKYFKNIEDLIRKDLTFKDEENFKQHAAYADIANTNSISIHIRCGDYLKKPKIKKRFCVCTKGYFERAIEYMKHHVENPKFFVFSDDHDWVKANLGFGKEFTFVKSSSEFEDMYLMSQCRHNIIPNSSFSWWGAWLNSNPQKIITAPDRWFTPLAKIDYKDIVPESWVKIDSGYGKEQSF